MALGSYRSKRSFDKTSEPKGRKKKKKDKALIFVIQKHAARRLHYDFRLEMEGVLKSWAVPKGPSLDPEVKRLAVHVEDHPLEYAKFEGTIPKGQYGAGTVEIWDQGTYTLTDPSQDPLEEFKNGKLSFILNGNKLKGIFALVRTSQENQWLLIKKKEPHAEVVKGKKLKMPRHVSPMQASPAARPFDNPEWIFEIKWNGLRTLGEVKSKKNQIYTHNFKSLNDQFPSLIQELEQFNKEMIVDGEIVILDEQGLPDIKLLKEKTFIKKNLRYYLFDLLYYDGQDLRGMPLIERKDLLKQILDPMPLNHIFYSDHVEGEGIAFLKAAQENGLKEIIGKNKDSVYQSKKSKDWLLIK